MFVARHDVSCPKCDSRLAAQTDGSSFTCDIAHHGERVHEAINRLDELIELATADVTAQIRVIVGAGAIREGVYAALKGYRQRKQIVAFKQDGNNTGAVLIQVRKA